MLVSTSHYTVVFGHT